MTDAADSAMVDVGGGVHAVRADFDGVPLTLYVLEGPGGRLALVDSGVASTPERHLLPALAAAGAGAADVETLVCTHAHHDHVGGMAALRDANPGLSIAIHRLDLAWAEDAARYFRELYEQLFPGAPLPGPGFRDRILSLMGGPTAVDHPLEDGDEVEAAGRRLTVTAAPAHTPGHVVLHDREAGVLFAGDALQAWGFEITGRPRLFPGYLSLHAYRASVEAIATAGAARVCTAHFGVLDADGVRRLADDSLAFTHALDDLLVGELRRRGRLTLAEGAASALAAWPQFEPGVQAYATVNAHLQELARAGRATPHAGAGAEKSWALI
ncbi:MAG TPA: MBL fold metallo-hydrolase [Baekduia sp.]|nr:MBL fold metallo-hydrolase [Baekduia sp.]